MNDKHKDVEYHVSSGRGSVGKPLVFDNLSEAQNAAMDRAMMDGYAILDVVIWSRNGAHHYGGDDGVSRYDEDPDASVFERFEVRVNFQGRIA